MRPIVPPASATDSSAAVSALHQAIKLLIQAGNFRQAADREKEVSRRGRRVLDLTPPLRLLKSTQPTDSISQKLAIATSGQAIGTSKRMRMRAFSIIACLEPLTVNRTANQCYQLAAELSAELADFPKSIQLYETVADWSLTSALTKYSVKEYWLRAALCSMAMGVSFLSLYLASAERA